ncbi:MAG: diguanylate cyclase domain-containing protein, partial [Fusobacteriaceae bacterium]
NIIENNSNGFIVLNEKKEIVYANKNITDIYGLDTEKKVGDYLKCTYTLNEDEHCQNTSNCTFCSINKAINKVIKYKKDEVLSEFLFDSSRKKMKLNCKIYSSSNFIVLEFLNLSDEEEKLKYLTRILDHSHDLLFYKDSSLRYKYLNKSFADFFEKEKTAIYNKTDEELLPENLYSQCLKSDLEAMKKGSYIGVENFGDREYQVLKEFIDGGVLGVVKDITEELKQTRLAEIDTLTNLYNRRRFLKMIDYIYENKIDEYFLLLIDLDDLRNLNNNFGHLKGDEYLKELGNIFNSHSEGLFFRIGGDEFAALIQRDEIKVEHFLKELYEELYDLKLNPKLSISIGVSKINTKISYLENYSIVDKLLYQSKCSGKNCYTLK